MKKGNIITILVVVFVVLLGVLYIENNRKKSQIIFQPADNNYDFLNDGSQAGIDYDLEIDNNLNGVVEESNSQSENIESDIILPKIPQTPFTVVSCQTFINAYSCQEGTMTSEGLVDCNPQYSRAKARCQQFIDGIADEYGEYIAEEISNVGAHGAYGESSIGELVFSSDIYLNQPAYIKGIGNINGIDVIKLDIITSVSKPFPEADWEIVNKSTKVRNYKISEEVGFFIGSNPTTKEVIVEHYLLNENNNLDFVNINTNRNGELMSITIPTVG